MFIQLIIFFLLSDDPYYSGLRARVPNFVKSSSKSNKEKDSITAKRMSIAHMQHPASLQSLHQIHQIHPHQQLMAAHQHHQQMMWHARSYESGIGIYDQFQYLMQQLPNDVNSNGNYHNYHHQRQHDGYNEISLEEWTEGSTDELDINQDNCRSNNLMLRNNNNNSNCYGYCTNNTKNNNYGLVVPNPKIKAKTNKWRSESSVFNPQTLYEECTTDEFSADSIERDKSGRKSSALSNFLYHKNQRTFSVDNIPNDATMIFPFHSQLVNFKNDQESDEAEHYVSQIFIQTGGKPEPIYGRNKRKEYIYGQIKSEPIYGQSIYTKKILAKAVSTESFFLENQFEPIDERFKSDKHKIDQIYYESAKIKIDEHMELLKNKEGLEAIFSSQDDCSLTEEKKDNEKGNVLVTFAKKPIEDEDKVHVPVQLPPPKRKIFIPQPSRVPRFKGIIKK